MPPLPPEHPPLPSCCQVLVVGAGPAGSSLAGQLAQAGVDVVLVDRLARLDQAAFSSAALPWSTVERFRLPPQVIAASWNRWQLHGPGLRTCRRWSADSGTRPCPPLGAVLDFAALRQWLAQRALAAGVRLQLGWSAEACSADGCSSDPPITQLRGPGGARWQLRSDWVVDASGEGRALLGDPVDPPLVSGVGVEWLLEVGRSSWEPWAGGLAFFLGSRWVRQGYGWVFPMQPGRLKLGVCRLLSGAGQPPLGQELLRLQRYCGLERASVLDRHGGRIRSTISRREPHRRGRLLGLGDAVSTANLLGGEGIRHALLAAEVLAPLLVQAVRQGNDRPLRAYPRRLRRALGWRWSLSGRLARRTWLGLCSAAADQRLERLLHGLEGCRAEDLSALLFDYRFERYGLRALPYLLGRR